MHFFVPLAAVLGLVAIAYFGAQANLTWVFGVAIPYLAILIFFEGLIYRIIQWVRSPVPFRIPTTTAQQRSLPWIKKTVQDKLDNPENFFQAVGRMALEILAFRSLFRNTNTELKKEPKYPEGARLIHWSNKWLWLGAIAFHYAFLLVLLRHLRFFSEPTWGFVHNIEILDGFLQFYTPAIYLTDILLLTALTYLLARRLVNPAIRYISIASDYFPFYIVTLRRPEVSIGQKRIILKHQITGNFVWGSRSIKNFRLPIDSPGFLIGDNFFINCLLFFNNDKF